MIKAVIDLGTNTFKCVVASVEGTRYNALSDFCISVKLGEALERDGIITPEAEKRALEALENILTECRELNAEIISCVGAMTLRTAANSSEFISLVKSRTGLNIRVLSGDEEAFLAWKAARDGLEGSQNETLVMDVGGGSTELVRGSASPSLAHSMPFGSLTLTSRFLHGNPPTAAELVSAGHHFQSLIPQDIVQGFSGQVIACGGTVTNFASVHLRLNQYAADRIHGINMATEDVEALLDRFGRMTLDHLRQMPGLQPQRAGIIVGGGIILSYILKSLSVSQFTVSTRGIRHALLVESEAARI